MSEELKNTSEASSLKPCPAGHTSVYLSTWEDCHGPLAVMVSQVRCDCGWEGPEIYGDGCEERAAEAWNTRPEYKWDDYTDWDSENPDSRRVQTTDIWNAAREMKEN